MKKIRKIIFVLLGALLGLCLLLAAISAIVNMGLPESSSVTEVLSKADKIRLAETIHIREQLGDAVFPGWGQADIPAILYNEEYVFLIGISNPSDGWIKVPAGLQRGKVWDLVSDDPFMGESYYRQRLSDPNITPEAFTVMVGDRWVASMPTLEWFKIGLVDHIRSDLPLLMRPVFPYPLFLRQLVNGSDQYVSLLSHEAFHSYQGMMNANKLIDSEMLNQYSDQYPWDNQSWQAELDVLAEALRSTNQNRTLELVRQFLALRASRRESTNLTAEMISYEQHREWLEGLARYAELEIWRQAFVGEYRPTSGTNELNDFQSYTNFEQRWTREIDQLTREANNAGDGRFYYTGMAQAYLLDHFLPDWKTQVFEDNVWLDDLLRVAVQNQD